MLSVQSRGLIPQDMDAPNMLHREETSIIFDTSSGKIRDISFPINCECIQIYTDGEVMIGDDPAVTMNLWEQISPIFSPMTNNCTCPLLSLTGPNGQSDQARFVKAPSWGNRPP